MRHFLLLVTLQAITRETVSDDQSYLFYVSPGNGQEKSGLYGGLLINVNNGKSRLPSPKEFGYQCVTVDGELLENPPYKLDSRDGEIREAGGDGRERGGLDGSWTGVGYDLQQLRSVSLDVVTKRVLVYSNEPSYTLFTAPVCHILSRSRQGSCVNASHGVEVLLYKAQGQPHFRIGPFAMHNSQIFFVLERIERVKNDAKRATIELRRILPKCYKQFPISAYATFWQNWQNCSDVLGVFVEETYSFHKSYSPMDHLMIVAGNSDILDFYLVMQRLINLEERSKLKAYAVLYNLRHRLNSVQSAQVPRARELNEQPISAEYIKYVLYHVGGISYAGVILCWSTIDGVSCGKHEEDGSISRIETYLKGIDIQQVCKGTDILSSIVTGLALADARQFSNGSRQIKFYFGCVAQTSGTGMGGSGLVNIAEDSSKMIGHLRSNESDTIIASTMFLATGCQKGYAVGAATSPACCIQANSRWIVLLFLVVIVNKHY